MEQAAADGWRPIHYACHNGNKDAVEFLHAIHCDILAKNDVGWTPAHIAIVHSEFEIVKFYHEIDLLRIANLTKVHASCGDVSFHGIPLVHLACLATTTMGIQNSAKNIVRYLHETCGFSIVSRDDNGCTPFHYAATAGALEVVEYLRDNAKMSTITTNYDGYTPLHYAQTMLINCMEDKVSLSPLEKKRYHHIIRLLLPLEELYNAKFFLHIGNHCCRNNFMHGTTLLLAQSRRSGRAR